MLCTFWLAPPHDGDSDECVMWRDGHYSAACGSSCDAGSRRMSDSVSGYFYEGVWLQGFWPPHAQASGVVILLY